VSASTLGIVTKPQAFVVLDELLKPLRPLLDSEITELCINQPEEVWIENNQGWQRHHIPALDLKALLSIARAVANSTSQKIDAQAPLLSATLPTGERVQFVIPPACENGKISVTIRKPSKITKTLDQYGREDYFAPARVSGESIKQEINRRESTHTTQGADTFTGDEAHHMRIGNNIKPALLDHPLLLDHEKILVECLLKKDFIGFFQNAVKHRMNVICSGQTGSGKTTFMKALANLIPSDERIITIEDARELIIPHKNQVNLLYSKDGQGVANITPKHLLEACLRMRPSRILLAELRGAEAFYYLRNVNSGHPGSLTSIHAKDEMAVFYQLALLIKESDSGREIPIGDLLKLCYPLIDISVQCGKGPQGRFCEGIYYDPLKSRLMDGL
jgi:type IV secretion system protein VirB11